MLKRLFVCLLLGLIALYCHAQDNDNINDLKNRIFHHYDKSEFEEVVRLGNEALAMYEADNNLYDMAGCYNVLGNAYQRMGRFKEAIESYEQCAEVMEKLKNSENDKDHARAARMYDRNIRYTRNNMGEIFIQIGELGHAESIYLNCIEMLGEPADTMDFRDLATYKQNLAEVYMKQALGMKGAEREASLNASVELAEQSVATAEQYESLPFKRINKKVTLAQAYHASGRLNESLRLAREVLDSEEANNDPYLEAEAHAVYGNCEAGMNRHPSAERHFAQALALANENHFSELQLVALEGAYTASKHFDKVLALDYFEQYAALRDSVFNEQQQQIIRDYIVKYDLAEKEYQLELEAAKNSRHRFIILILGILAVMLLAVIVLVMRIGAIRKRNHEIEGRLNMAKNHLFSIVSHDFKTSLLSQNLMLGVMNDHFDNMSQADIKENVSQLKTSSDLLKEDMFNLIEWMKTELNSGEENYDTFGLRKVVEECMRTQKTDATKKQLTLDNRVNEYLKARDNENLVKLVLRNLISNAVKYSQPGGTIEITAREDGKRVWLAVTDHGTGFDAASREAFDNGVIKASGESGSGIGLMLCKQVIERNGGEIIVESREGEGATVRFTINKH